MLTASGGQPRLLPGLRHLPAWATSFCSCTPSAPPSSENLPLISSQGCREGPHPWQTLTWLVKWPLRSLEWGS